VCLKYLPVLALYSDTWTISRGAAWHVSQIAYALLTHRYHITYKVYFYLVILHLIIVFYIYTYDIGNHIWYDISISLIL
jgi:hypothetical protein